eukprot:15366226-Ditylum_brightwellii.AAC.1
MVTFPKQLTAGKPQGNGPQELKPIILIERPQICGGVVEVLSEPASHHHRTKHHGPSSQGSEWTPIGTGLQGNCGRPCVNKMNNHLEQFLPRDNRSPQVKLVEDELMDILENAVPKSWQGEMHRQRFDCASKGQTKFIQLCKCLELLDPPTQGQKGRYDVM